MLDSINCPEQEMLFVIWLTADNPNKGPPSPFIQNRVYGNGFSILDNLFQVTHFTIALIKLMISVLGKTYTEIHGYLLNKLMYAKTAWSS